MVGSKSLTLTQTEGFDFVFTKLPLWLLAMGESVGGLTTVATISVQLKVKLGGSIVTRITMESTN